jgi:hypothetical protein
MEDPVIISKELRKRNPDKLEFEKKNKEIELAIDKLRTKMTTLNYKRREMNEGGKVANTQMTRKEFLS